MTDKNQPEVELLLNGEPYRGKCEMRPEPEHPRSLEEKTAHLCSHNRDMLCSA